MTLLGARRGPCSRLGGADGGSAAGSTTSPKESHRDRTTRRRPILQTPSRAHVRPGARVSVRSSAPGARRLAARSPPAGAPAACGGRAPRPPRCGAVLPPRARRAIPRARAGVRRRGPRPPGGRRGRKPVPPRRAPHRGAGAPIVARSFGRTRRRIRRTGRARGRRTRRRRVVTCRYARRGGRSSVAAPDPSLEVPVSSWSPR